MQHATSRITSRKGGNGPGRVSPLVPVQSRTGTNGGIAPGSLAPGAGRATWAIGPGSSGPFGPSWWDEPGPTCLAPGPPPFVPVGGLNRDQRLPISPGSCHQPGPINCLYIPREQSTLTALFFMADEEKALWCSSSPPMHTRCSMECLSHTT